MELPSPATVRRYCAPLGAVLGTAWLVLAYIAVTTRWLFVTGLGVVILVVALTFSLPLVAAGLAYALSEVGVGAPPRTERTLRVAAFVTFGLFVFGFGAVLTGVEPVRSVGDVVYGAGAVMLVALSVAVLVVERRATDADESR